jgi:rod shape determining protein RodA
MIFVRGLSWPKILIVFAAVAVLVGAFAVNEIFRLHPLLKEYHRDRIRTFLDPEADPLGRGYNATQARIAVGSGGFWGKGIGDGDMSGLGFIPRTVANNDFIFAVIAEETGFAGAFCLIVLFGVLILSCFAIAWRAPDIFGRVLASGFGTMLFCHVFVNIGMNINLAPVTGIPLPLVSYGGTFLVTTMAMLGILQSISRTGALLISGR